MTLLSLGLALNYYREASQADLSRLHSLEEEIAQLKGGPSTTPSSLSSSSDPPKQITILGPLSPDLVLGGNKTPGIHPRLLATLLPSGAFPIIERQKNPLAIVSLKVQREKKALKINFAMEYTSEDKGSQQGTILLLAHGAKTLMTYPEDALGNLQNETLLLPQKGEHFSVSRFREVEAEFGPANSTETFKKIEILIFNPEGRLLIHQSVEPEGVPESS